MHGLIFLYMQRFAQERAGAAAWQQVLREAELSSKAYSPVQEYPDYEAMRLFGALSSVIGTDLHQTIQAFGTFVAPALVQLHASLIHPDWRTIEVIANTEELIHRTVRMRNPGAKPPMLECTRTDANSIQIIYSSPRRLCSLGKGIVSGLAELYGDKITIDEQACMLHGDPFCAMQVQREAHDSEPAYKSEPLETKIKQETFTVHTIAPAAVAVPETVVASPGTQPMIRTNTIFPFLDSPKAPGEIGSLAHYRVLRLLGQGGMGMVFHAEDSRLDRPVALKVLMSHHAMDNNLRQRFIREARALAILRHSHIVAVYDVGLEHELPYLVMEFLEGESLEEYYKRIKTLAPAQIVDIARDIAKGLTAAHAKGVIHRDIKPSNLWMDSGTGHVKLLDFGLARLAAEEHQLTEHGLVLGTPAFMAPEQANGTPVDTRADLFSLGCVIYWMCTGKSPFAGTNTMNTLALLTRSTPPAPHETNPQIPNALSEIVMHLLAKNPEDRPSTSRQVLDKLNGIQVA